MRLLRATLGNDDHDHDHHDDHHDHHDDDDDHSGTVLCLQHQEFW